MSFKGEVLTVHRNSGDTVSVALAPNVAVGAVKNIKLSDIKPGTDNVLIRAKLHGPFEPIRGPSDSLDLFDQLCLVRVLLEYAFEEFFCKVISETFNL